MQSAAWLARTPYQTTLPRISRRSGLPRIAPHAAAVGPPENGRRHHRRRRNRHVDAVADLDGERRSYESDKAPEQDAGHSIEITASGRPVDLDRDVIVNGNHKARDKQRNERRSHEPREIYRETLRQDASLYARAQPIPNCKV